MTEPLTPERLDLDEVEHLHREATGEAADADADAKLVDEIVPQLIAELRTTRAELDRRDQAEAEAVRLRQVAERAFTELEHGEIHEAEQTLREALHVPAIADPERATKPAPKPGGCSCSGEGTCPTCTSEQAALLGSLADEANAPGGING